MYHIWIDQTVFLIIINYYQLFYKSHKLIFDNHATIETPLTDLKQKCTTAKNLRQWTNSSVDEFVHCLEEYIHYYNNTRISLKLKGMSPVQYKTHSNTI